MLQSKAIVLAFAGCALYLEGVGALSRRTSVLRNDTFDGFGPLEGPLEIQQDQGGTLRYSPQMSVTSKGESTGGMVTVGIERASGTNLAVNLDESRPDITLSSVNGGCTRLEGTYFACTQISVGQPTANLPLSCTLTIEALGPPAYPNGPDTIIQSQPFDFTPKLKIDYNPIRVTSTMTGKDISLPAALKYRLSVRTTDIDALDRLLNFLKESLGVLSPLLSPALMVLKTLFGQVNTAAVVLFLDNVIYETGVECPV